MVFFLILSAFWARSGLDIYHTQVWLWVDDMGGPLGLINRRIGDGLVGYRWRAGGSNGLNMPEGYENWNRLQGQPDNGKLKGAIAAF